MIHWRNAQSRPRRRARRINTANVVRPASTITSSFAAMVPGRALGFCPVRSPPTDVTHRKPFDTAVVTLRVRDWSGRGGDCGRDDGTGAGGGTGRWLTAFGCACATPAIARHPATMPEAIPLRTRPTNCTKFVQVCRNARNAAAEAVSTFVLPHRGHLYETERPRGYQLYPHPWHRLSGRFVNRLMERWRRGVNFVRGGFPRHFTRLYSRSHR